MPLFTALLAVVFSANASEPGVVTIAVGFLGVARSVGGEGIRRQRWALLVLLAAVSGSIYFSFQKPYLEKYGSVTFTAYAVWAGALLACAFFPTQC